TPRAAAPTTTSSSPRGTSIAAGVAGPDEVLAGDVEVPLGLLDVVVGAAARGVEVGHDRSDDEDLERAVHVEADDLVAPDGVGARGAAAAGVLLGGGDARLGVGVGDVVGGGGGPVGVV